MAKPSETPKYSTIQVRYDLKQDIVEYCNRQGYKISGFVEKLFQQHISGSQNTPSHFANILEKGS